MSLKNYIPVDLLWLPYVVLSIVLIALAFASFIHYHLQNRMKYKYAAANSNIVHAQSQLPVNTKFRVTMSRNGRVMHLEPISFPLTNHHTDAITLKQQTAEATTVTTTDCCEPKTINYSTFNVQTTTTQNEAIAMPEIVAAKVIDSAKGYRRQIKNGLALTGSRNNAAGSKLDGYRNEAYCPSEFNNCRYMDSDFGSGCDHTDSDVGLGCDHIDSDVRAESDVGPECDHTDSDVGPECDHADSDVGPECDHTDSDVGPDCDHTESDLSPKCDQTHISQIQNQDTNIPKKNSTQCWVNQRTDDQYLTTEHNFSGITVDDEQKTNPTVTNDGKPEQNTNPRYCQSAINW